MGPTSPPTLLPDTAPSDFRLFGKVKSNFVGVQFEDNNAVLSYVQEWVHNQQRNFWQKGIKVVKTLEKMY